MKSIRNVMIIGLCIGFASLMIQKLFAIDEGAFMHGYWLVAWMIVIGAALINIFYNMYYYNKTEKIAKLLHEGKPQEYIDGIEALLKTARGKNLRNILVLNLAAGYMETKQFDVAIAILEEVSDKQLKGSAVNVVHRINLGISYFETAQYEKIIALYNENQSLFQKYRNHKVYGANIAILDVMIAIINKEYDQAEKLLDTAHRKYLDSRFQKAFCEISHTLNQMKKEFV